MFSENVTAVTEMVAIILYGVLGLIALWGAYSVIMAWRRVGQTRFRSEEEQMQFLADIEDDFANGDINSVRAACDGDPRALPQLALLAISNRDLGFAKVRALLIERFQRDVLADLEYRLSWVQTVIKSAPMVGLLGTVVGMMGAFSKLSAAETVRPENLASDIMVALITTACGLAIAIPLVLATASINVRIAKMEDLVGSGLTRFLDAFRPLTRSS